MNEIPWGIISIVIAISGSVWSLAWWLNGHFNQLREGFMDIAKEIIEKLEYHERHDDQRFNQIRDDIWSLRVLNASTDKPIKRKETN